MRPLELAASQVTAVFAANDQMALGLIRGLHERALRVPEDVSVVGFDDKPEAEFFMPPLTTVRQDFAAVGRRSVEVLLDDVAAEERSARRITLAPVLVVRASTGPVVAG